ncbi:hypothetical protein MMC30_008175 [Trapelia coarctata]|nr:hypothetical protein [Trapelia coarctata]
MGSPPLQARAPRLKYQDACIQQVLEQHFGIAICGGRISKEIKETPLSVANGANNANKSQPPSIWCSPFCDLKIEQLAKYFEGYKDFKAIGALARLVDRHILDIGKTSLWTKLDCDKNILTKPMGVKFALPPQVSNSSNLFNIESQGSHLSTIESQPATESTALIRDRKPPTSAKASTADISAAHSQRSDKSKAPSNTFPNTKVPAKDERPSTSPALPEVASNGYGPSFPENHSDFAYWLETKALSIPSIIGSLDLKEYVCVIPKLNLTSPFLTVVFDDHGADENATTSEMRETYLRHKLAVKAGGALYTRFRLRQAAAVTKGQNASLQGILHFGISIHREGIFLFYELSPKTTGKSSSASFSWTGLIMKKCFGGCLDDVGDLTLLVKTVQKIAGWVEGKAGYIAELKDDLCCVINIQPETQPETSVAEEESSEKPV